MKPLTYCMASLAVCGALALPTMASAQAPLIYEGRLTTHNQPPDPWPGLRFSVVDADGAVWWSTLVDPDGPLIDAGPDGRFVAYLEDSVDNPWALAGFDEGRWLRVEVCPGPWPANPADACPWVQLEQTQRLGTVPMAEAVSQAERERIRAEVMAEMWVVPDVPGGDVATLRVSQSGEEGTFGSVQEALASLSHKGIPTGMRVEISIEPADTPYVSATPITIDRADGQQIHIIGETPPEGSFLDVVLSFPGHPSPPGDEAPPGSAGVVVEDGARLGLLDGVTLLGAGVRDDLDISGSTRTLAGSSSRKNGVHVRPGGVIRLGADVHIENFGGDCLYTMAGVILAPGIEMNDCRRRGAVADFGGFIDLTGARIGYTAERTLGALWSGGVFARGVTIHAPWQGVIADAAGWMDIFGAEWLTDDPEMRPLVVTDDNSFMLHGLSEDYDVGQDASYAR